MTRTWHRAMVWLCMGCAVSVIAWAGSLPVQASSPGDGRESSQKKPCNVAQLAWMEGRWVGTIDGDPVEEVWSAPHGNSLMGMFRWTRGGNVWIFELLTIVEQDDALALRFKHFDAALVGWEEKDKPLTFKLVHIKPNEVAFDFIGDEPWRYTYRKTGENELTVVFKQSKDGKPTTREIPLKRAARAGD